MMGVFAEFERGMMVESALGCCEGQGERHQERETLKLPPVLAFKITVKAPSCC
jgi:hypothetical protein